MNIFNRLVMIIFALILIAVPVLLILIGYGVIPPARVDSYFDYRAALRALGGFSVSTIRSSRTVFGIGGIIAAVVFFILFLRELIPGVNRPDDVVIDESPGREVRIQPRALKAMAEGAALEAGALSANVVLRGEGDRNRVRCTIEAPTDTDLSSLAQKVREYITKEFEKQNVPPGEVEVIVSRTLQPSGRRSIE